MPTTAELRRRAEECRSRAKATDDILLKAHWLELADYWMRLGDRADRVASMACSTPAGLANVAHYQTAVV